jgi:hypothetical protein
MSRSSSLLVAAAVLAALLAGAGLPVLAATETVHIPVAGGIELATDIYLPAQQPAPVVLIRTPYGRTGHDFLGEAFSAEGYAVVIQDVRGKYDSSGEHAPFRHEESDGLVTLRWIAGRDWCNGRIGIWGISYSGYSGLILADAAIPELRSILSYSGWLDAEEVVRPGGAIHLMLDLPWMLTQQGRRQRGLSQFNMDELFRHLPLNEAMRAAGIRNSTWEDPSFLDRLGAQRKPGEVKRPVLHLTGWSDMVYQASLGAHERLSANASAPQKLIVGPWFHDQAMMGVWEVGDADFGEASGFGVDELIALSLRWFDATLKREKNGFLEEPDVTYFLMGQNAWHRASSWPPPETEIRVERWYVDSGGGANTLSGDGKLSTAPPEGAESDRFVFNPSDPVPTHGGANFHFFPEHLGVRDQREIERRTDVLVYTSTPLGREIQITGRLRARLYVATSGRGTDFTAKLVVVRPDGYARIVEEGIARASAQLPSLPPPGQPFALDVELGDTAIAVPPGHRLRLEISSSNFPRYDRNPNTGEDPFTARTLVKARQTVFHTEDRASYIALPIRREPLVASSRGREPLVRPAAASSVGVVSAAGDDAGTLLADGRDALEEGELDRAVATFERAVELRPEASEGYFWLGRGYVAQLQQASLFKKLKLSKMTREAYLRAIELDPDNVEARSSLAAFYFNAPGVAGGSSEKGMAQVEEIRKRDPATAHQILAGMYAGQDQPEKAIAEYRALIAVDPERADAYYRLGLMLQQEERWEEAFETFESGVRKTKDYRSLYQVGRTAVFSGRKLDRARRALEEYIAAAPDGPALPSVAAARWRLGMVHERMGNREQARREYEAALELEPDLEQARDALENLG